MIIHTRNSYLNAAQRELIKRVAQLVSKHTLISATFFNRYRDREKELPFTVFLSLSFYLSLLELNKWPSLSKEIHTYSRVSKRTPLQLLPALVSCFSLVSYIYKLFAASHV